MLRYINHNLTAIDGVSIYPIISLLIFVVFFVFMFVYVLRMKKSYINDVSAMPLEDSELEEVRFD